MTFFDITAPARPAFRSPLALLARIRTWVALSRQRRHLAELDRDALSDMGIRPEDARREAARPFWDAPDHWTH